MEGCILDSSDYKIADIYVSMVKWITEFVVAE